MICMAGTHQIWSLDMRQNLCRFYSGGGSEGNENSDPRSSTWAQPSGITAGTFNGEAHIFIADSESSSIRAINQDTENACNVAGANQDSKDLFCFLQQSVNCTLPKLFILSTFVMSSSHFSYIFVE